MTSIYPTVNEENTKQSWICLFFISFSSENFHSFIFFLRKSCDVRAAVSTRTERFLPCDKPSAPQDHKKLLLQVIKGLYHCTFPPTKLLQERIFRSSNNLRLSKLPVAHDLSHCRTTYMLPSRLAASTSIWIHDFSENCIQLSYVLATDDEKAHP